MELFSVHTWGTRYAHATGFVVGLHGTQKIHPIVKYEHNAYGKHLTLSFYEISSGARASQAQSASVV